MILSSNQNMSPVQVLQTMLQHSIGNTVNLLSLSDTHRLTTPNLVAAMPPANSTTNVELLCRSVWSERSGVTSTDRAVSRCRQGEEMMGCSSYAPDGVRVGETITGVHLGPCWGLILPATSRWGDLSLGRTLTDCALICDSAVLGPVAGATAAVSAIATGEAGLAVCCRVQTSRAARPDSSMSLSQTTLSPAP
ncbi:proprotein convertase subtilisin/kexin type 9 isoform X1 [Lates japonicus]|uniref:Proprotein convertase subtilisin/kexin type 9 isoform X1 n=1 Tax=Lates japonicus TaxID=270547 RepID=A0AAD3MDH2_LATJO|nr:proprotein convertase subtilisin/kexin type 9 isoform X1 [Lates japonicus]